MTAVVQGRSAAEWHVGLLQSTRLNQWLKTYGSPPFGGPKTLSRGEGAAFCISGFFIMIHNSSKSVMK